MNSNSTIPFFLALSLLSATPLLQSVNGTPTAADNSLMNTEIYSNDFSSLSVSEQFIPPVNYRDRYKKIKASDNFKKAYYNRSLGENILIEE